MTFLLEALALLFLLSCTSSYEKAIINDEDTYCILEQAEYALVRTSYASLYAQPDLQAKIKGLLRKNTIVRIIFVKSQASEHPPRTWYYIENTENLDEKGWLAPYDITLSPNIYNARLLKEQSKA